MTRTAQPILRLLVAAALLSCSGAEILEPDPASILESITVTLPRPMVRVGESVQASAALLNASGAVLPGRTITWTSSNSTSAAVSESGVVTALAPGQVNIHATTEGKIGQATLTVTAIPVASITVSPPTANVPVGQTLALQAMLSDSAGNGLTGRMITWTSSVPARASVSPEGVVSGLAAGAVDITAASEGKNALSRIEIIPVIANIAVALPRGMVRVGESVQVNATVSDAGGTVLQGHAVIWHSSNASVATVSESGTVKALAAGESSIRASAGEVVGQATLAVTVVPVSSVTVSPPTANVPVGQALALAATLSDSAGNGLSGRIVTWASSDPSRASVSLEGIVTGLAAGTADISASSEGKAALSRIDVVPVVSAQPVVSVTLAMPRTAFRVGESLQAGALPLDENGGVLTGRTIAWSSSNSGVATVSQGGLVTGVGPGAATIAADVEGKTGTLPIEVSLVPVATVTITPNSETVAAGGSVALTAVLKDSADRELTGRGVAWTSSSPGIATVSEAGIVSGITVGSTTITAASEGKHGMATVTVNTLNTPVASVTVSPSNTSMAGVGKKQLTATLRDANGNVLSGRPIDWVSSNPDRATVSATGEVTAAAVDAPVVITATSEGKSGTSSIDIVTFVRMSSGTGFSCGLTGDGTAYCWGQNGLGQIGDGTFTSKLLPTRVSTELKFVLIASGSGHSCGIVLSGLAYCWGQNGSGQLSGGVAGSKSAVPVPVRGGYTFTSIATGTGSTCATTVERDVYCWGLILYDSDMMPSPIGIGGGTPRWVSQTEPLKVGSGMVAVVAGLDGRFCSVDNSGVAYCWSVVFTTPWSGAVIPPIRGSVSTSHHFTTLRMGPGHVCGLVASGQAYCWGQNNVGQLGDGTTIFRATPVLVTGGFLFESLAAGGNSVEVSISQSVTAGFSCGLTQTGKTYCWGSNADGRLGIGTSAASSPVPVPIAGPNFTGIRAGANHVCGLPLGDGASCWGNNSSGQLGNGTTTPSNKPTPLFGP